MCSLHVHGLGVLLLCAPLAAQAVPEIRFDTLRRSLPDDGNPDREGIRMLAWVDWEGDGDLDALRAANVYACGSSLQLLENDGEGRFVRGFEAAHPLFGVVAGDLDGDGDADAWVTSNSLSHRILWNDGSAGVRAADVAMGAQVLADMDGDGRLDGVRTWPPITWSANLGNETFAGPAMIDGRGGILDALIADLDGDGDPDVFLMLATGLAFLFNDGLGGFAEQVLLPPAYLDLEAPLSVLLAAGDIDGDGLAEVFYSDAHLVDPHAIHMLRNRGAHLFEDASDDLPELEDVSFLVLADVEGDADLDLLTSRGVLLNDGAGFFLAGSALPSGAGVSAGDLDGDGDVDLAYGATNQILFNDGSGHFGELDLEPSPSGGFALGDIDADGDLDVGALKNDGRGELSREPGTDLGALDSAQALSGDLDGDGDLDLFHPGVNRMARNDGSGVFVLADACSPSTSDRIDAALGDLDGDGDLDAYLGRVGVFRNCDPTPCYGPRVDELLLNDGTGCFVSASARLPQDARVTFGVVLVDLDGDGNLDVVTSARRLLLNLGGGTFVDASDRIAGPEFAHDVAVGDLDGDGALDLYFAGSREPAYFGTDPDFVLWNDGTAHFPTGNTTPGSGILVALGDLDLDGDMDVVESAAACFGWADEVRVLSNEGTRPGFSVVSRTPGRPLAMNLGDLDRDGDLDLLDGTRVVFNLRRSLAQRGLARLGRDLALELHGSHNGGALLVAASALAPAATPFGLRQIALDTRLFARQVALDGKGRAEAHFTVPGDAALIGTTLHWQALISAPLRWSAREETTVTGF